MSSATSFSFLSEIVQSLFFDDAVGQSRKMSCGERLHVLTKLKVCVTDERLHKGNQRGFDSEASKMEKWISSY